MNNTEDDVNLNLDYNANDDCCYTDADDIANIIHPNI